MVMMTARTPSEKASRRVVGKSFSCIGLRVLLGVRIHWAEECLTPICTDDADFEILEDYGFALSSPSRYKGSRRRFLT